MSEESEVEKGMSEFYRRTLDRLPVTPSTKPFEVQIDVQETKSVPFGSLTKVEPPKLGDEQQNTLGPPPVGITSVNPNKVSSGGGTTVTILGSNFVSGATVKIAGISATSVNFVNSGKLTCIAPADGLGWMSVEVTNPSGQSASLSSAILYVAWPDNVLISGPTKVLAVTGFSNYYFYNYSITLRVGAEVFTVPVGVSVYLVGNLTPHGPYASRIPDPEPYVVWMQGQGFVFTSVTGPTWNTQLGLLGAVGDSFTFTITLGHASDLIPTIYPIYGDPINQPTTFAILFTTDGVPPLTGAGADFLAWSADAISGRINPWSWLPGDIGHTIHIKKTHANGSVDTTFSGTATISLVNEGASALSVGFPGTVAFTAGVTTFSVTARNDYTNAAGSQSLAYFYFVATSGTMSNRSPEATALNHL
jgi:hypothetical protein